MFTLKPIRTLEEYNALKAQAEADGHILIAPTHVVLRDGKAIGTVSIVPTAHIWMDTREAKVRDSLNLEAHLNTLLSANGQAYMCVPCTKESPYHEFLKANQFQNIGSYDLFMKGLQ